jgi:hypothetical protein
MAPPQTNPTDAIPQDLVNKVGAAAGQIARIQSDFTTQVEMETAAEAREALAQRARTAAEEAIDEQGITVHDYNTVLAAAEGDQELERRLVDAAREVM